MNELRSLLLSNYRTLLLSNASYALAYIRRQANIVAHNLARASISDVSPSIFFYPPDCIHLLFLTFETLITQFSMQKLLHLFP
jgi:hypothetical protein